ncbi:MAG: tyrosine--tRNA ligase [Candidatus Magasanikbacteria bacterium CG10_big_fil_rev_8_21_14_0_10_36_16]|uniref:Tyrosine--tRNA ligase n=1 Tax=Candidatus Magasanikbacteria bacterium CG10_big_fil_rev_8_21_14_0_10_36_16 TaxID=1974645 RepID=A0A2H0TY92_9BACT|nr:MAG: tyrosine--tRNA ligase [Candidatus Magasanikbacteria bacterium CG10_big_fil_rev_8_21_14_0_10_36_16]
MKIITDENKIQELLERGVEEVIVKESLKKKLESGRQLTVKFGIDPTGSSIHIGHAVPLQKLRQFQELGHHVILLIGDYTAMIGDPTGRNATRPMLTKDDIQKNMKNYIAQAGKILDMDNVEVRYNSEWFEKKGASFMMELTGMVTVARILDRDDFQKRLKEGSDIAMQEILYPLMQGYDSVELKADVEIGGTDQKFNLLMGRKLQKKYNQEEQDVVTVPLLEGTDGEKKMSKTYDNFIAVLDTPEDIFGKTMSIPDGLIIKYFKLATAVPMEEVNEYEKMLATGTNPKDIKMKLAFALTEFYCDKEGALQGQTNFEKVIQSKDRPDEIAELKPASYNIIEVLVESGLCTGKSDARRAIEQGGVKVNDEKIEAFDYDTKPEDVIQKGKRFFVKVK